MAPKAAQKAAQTKAAKQKKILIGLGLLLVVALGYAVMTLSNLNSSPPVSAIPASATTAAGSIATDTAATAGTAGIAAPPVRALRTFAALGRKDPFNDHGPNMSSTASSSTKTPTGSGSSSKPKQTPVALTGAVISINGTKLSLALGAIFGHAPGLSGVALFRLVKVSAKTAVIGVVGTQQRFTLHVRQPLTLAQSGGWKYTLILEPLGSAAPMTVEGTTGKPSN